MRGLALFLLGPFAATLNDQPFGGFRIRPAQALAVYLACRPQAHHREHLMGLLWPESSPADAHHNLRQSLYVLRQILPQVAPRTGTRPVPLVIAEQDRLLINPDAAVAVDIHQFAALLRKNAPDQTKEAVALYRGDFLADFYLPNSNPFEAWVAERRADLRRMMLEALDSLSALAGQHNAYREMAGYARRQLAIDNLSENAHWQLMWALAHNDERIEALTHYERFVKLLNEEMGIAPSAETSALAERIARGSDEWAVPPDGVAGAQQPHNLPAQLSSFVGREREMGEVQALLASARLVTLTGAGGCGKTRLALEVAKRILPGFRDGVWLTEFAPLSDPALVGQTVAATLGVSDLSGRSIEAVLAESLRSKTCLLLLDNCEHLLEACARLSERLLRACPHVRILATSRESLGITGEATYLVPSLATADPDALPPLPELARVEAIQLFVERAGTARSGFALASDNAAAIAQTCRRLDGIPLAIELAAARVRAMTPQQIAQRLEVGLQWLADGRRTSPERQQTLWATIEWSHNLLTPSERILFRRLAVFAGGWTLEAAEAVCAGDGLATTDVLELLINLVEKSLVLAVERDGEMRYGRLETVRQYACEQLQESGEREQMRRRHLEYFLDFARMGDPELRGPRSLEWTMRMEREHDNFRAALESAFSSGPEDASGPQLAIALAGTTGFGFWDKRSHLTEAAYWLRKALDHGSVLPGTALQAKLQFHYSVHANFVETWEVLKPLLEESLATFQALGEPYRVDRAYVLMWLGWWLFFRHERERGYRYSWEALHIFRESGELWGQAFALNFISCLKLEDEQFAAALELAEEGLAAAQACGDRHNIAILLSNLGESNLRWGLYCEAEPYLEAALTLLNQLGNKGFTCQVLKLLGDVARATGDYDQAEAHYQESWAMARDMGWLSYGINLAAPLGYTRLHRGETEAAKAAFAEALELGTVYDRKSMLIYHLACLAGVGARQGSWEAAARLFGAFDAQLQLLLAEGYKMIQLLDAIDRMELEYYSAMCRTALGAAAYDTLFAAGQRLSLEEATALARQIQDTATDSSSSP